ncbi:MAG: ABC transporter permease [Treponema sp.]|nr:ABC transporter permease [Treponema sp.]
MILQIISSSIPLVLVTMGALMSEYTGRMALFLDGLVNLSAFLCFAFTMLTKNVFLASFLSILVSTAFIALAERITTKTKANPFLTGLALNLLCSAMASMISSIAFNTRGVLTSLDLFSFDAKLARNITSLIGIFIIITVVFVLYKTKKGLYFRITGTDEKVLEARGINTGYYKFSGWIGAAIFGSLAGCFLSIRLSSFVPNISSGRGWTALAAVYLGKKNAAAVIGAALILSAAEFAASNAQNISLFATIPSSILLALPYIVSIILILFIH